MKIDWIYKNSEDNSARFVLGNDGKNPLICFGINPSTASPEKLDRTIESVKRIVEQNGFDGWIMLNVYPQRSTNPNDLDFEFDEELHKKNLEHIEEIFKIYNPVIWAAWGTLIGKRKYLPSCLLDIITISKKYNCKWVTFGKKSKAGHPHHPLYVSTKSLNEEFLIEEYVRQL